MAEPTSIACLEVWGGNEPVDTHVRVPGLDVFVYAVPFENAAAGGDVHFVSSCGSGRIARLMVADVSGHGEAVAKTGRTLRSLIHRYMNHIDQRKLLMSMNDAFVELAETGRFATAVVMTYYAPTAQLSLCNAGHPPPLLRKASLGTWRYLDDDAPAAMPGVRNIPLGILNNVGYEQLDVTLERGDLVLAYTDSLIEAICADREELGARRLLDVIAGLDATDPAAIVPTLLAALGRLGATLNDDVTIVLARSEGTSNGAGVLGRLGAQARFVGQLLTLRRDLPWPEWSWQNVGGAIASSFGRRAAPRK